MKSFFHSGTFPLVLLGGLLAVTGCRSGTGSSPRPMMPPHARFEIRNENQNCTLGAFRSSLGVSNKGSSLNPNMPAIRTLGNT